MSGVDPDFFLAFSFWDLYSKIQGLCSLSLSLLKHLLKSWLLQDCLLVLLKSCNIFYYLSKTLWSLSFTGSPLASSVRKLMSSLTLVLPQCARCEEPTFASSHRRWGLLLGPPEATSAPGWTSWTASPHRAGIPALIILVASHWCGSSL